MRQSEALRHCELVVIGDGPQRAELESLTGSLEAGDVVQFRGNIDNAKIADELRSAQVFVFPSLREFGGGVVLEAMASGLPCIVVDYGGPAELLNSDSGILLPMRRRDEMVANLRAAMESLASDSPRCGAMGAAGVQRVRDHFTWSAKADRIAAIYRDIV